jgi:hypothetical protein
MDMDDPWGSPWADEIQPPHPISTKESHDVGVVQRPKTPVKASSLALQEKTNSSPWDDANDADDGFGDWAADPGTGLDGAKDDGWGSSLGSDIRFTKPDTNGFSEAWDATPTFPEEDISKLGPSALPKPAGIARQPSLDPWAFDGAVDEQPKLSNADTTGQEHGEGANNTTIEDFGWDSSENHHATNGDSELWPETKDIPIGEVTAAASEAKHRVADGMEGNALEAVNNTVENAEADSKAHKESPGAELELLPEPEDNRSKEPFEEQGAARLEEGEGSKESEKPSNTPERASTSHEADPMSSRPSSSPSERSQHDDVFSESPRTSLEEDPKRPQIPRKVSSKVQELVEHFDTLAQKEETPSIISGHTSAAEGRVEVTEQPEDDADDMDDFGDFEDGQSEIDEPTEESEPAAPATPESKALPKDSEPVLSHSPENRTPKKEYGPVDFPFDASLLSKLYQQGDDEPSTESIFISDRAPHDSFTSTEQRKTWYRLSRYGPMRKHNMGDDENYTRVNWTQSEIRVETLKIVARWIEEDRMSGRVMLGGGSKAGSMFGWNDQKAAPTSISAAFASKAMTKKVETVPVAPAVEVPREWPQGLVRDRSTSKSRSPSKARRRSSVKSIKSPEEVKGDRQSPVANFGWNSGPEGFPKSHSRNTSTKGSFGSISNAIPLTNSPSPTQKRTSSSRSSSTTSKPTEPIQKKPISATNILLPPLNSKTILSPIAPTPAAAEFFDGEDDWGEMISSPVVSTPPVLPQPNSLRHKKSQSLIGNFPSAKTSMTPIAPRQSMDSAQPHRSMASFDDILMPEKNSPQSAKSPETFNTFSTPSSAFGSPVGQSSTAQPIAAGPSDPWDLSFFDTPPAPVPAPASKPSPLPKSTPLKTVSFANTRASPASPATRKLKEEIEQDRIVQSVIKGLPDLSYMLRR